MTATTIGRKPITIVELEQPRCTERFGVSPCTATGTNCYNCPGTCGDLANLNNDGSIKWRFMDDRPGVFGFGDFSDADNPELPAIPCGVNVSTSQSQINAGAMLDGRSPLGVTSKVTVNLSDFRWNDMWGDHYVTSRTGYTSGKPLPSRGPFWALWTARNELFKDMYLRIYDGYEGQTLAQMRQRLYTLENISGPTSEGKVTLTGHDPLRKAGDKKAEFPRTSDLDIYGATDATTTAVQVFGSEDDLTADFGNTGSNRYLVVGEEIMLYTGYTDEGDGVFTLTGVERGALGTTADAHDDQDKAQRAGRYENEKFWTVLADLLQNHTEIDPTLLPEADWDAEGDVYLPTYRTTRTIVDPTPIQTLAGQLTQQGLFYIWWEEYAQQIKMLAVRAPDADPDVLTDETHLIAGTTLRRDPDARVTQVAVYYGLINPFGGLSEPTNYAKRYTAINGDNLGEPRIVSIYAPWIDIRTQAVQLSVRLLTRYKNTPRFLTITVDAKDRAYVTGSVLDVETSAIVNSEGAVDRLRWQVISAKEVQPGHSYLLDLQTYEFLGRFGRYMADGSVDYGSATEAQKATGAWYADDDGELPDGTEGYLYQ